MSLYVLKHYDTDIDNIRIFTNLDNALEGLHQWLENDDYLLNYAISKYDLNSDLGEYEHVDDIDLDAIIGHDEDELNIISHLLNNSNPFNQPNVSEDGGEDAESVIDSE